MVECPDPKSACAPRNRTANPPHADNAERFAIDPVAKHPARFPASPFALSDQLFPLAEPSRHREDQRHRHVGSIFGKNARRVGNDNALRARRSKIDMIDANAEIRDELKSRAGLCNKISIDHVGNRRRKHVGGYHRLLKRSTRHGGTAQVDLGIEQFAHPVHHMIGQFGGDDQFGALRMAIGGQGVDAGHGLVARMIIAALQAWLDARREFVALILESNRVGHQ